jgi:hypothetical protein
MLGRGSKYGALKAKKMATGIFRAFKIAVG